MNGTPTRTLQADVVVAGSGPGGATVARELSRKGKKVIVCEAGKYHRWFGSTLSLLRMLDRKGMTFSREGNWIVWGRTAGGGTLVYGGYAAKPPGWFQEKYGIDLDKDCQTPIKRCYCMDASVIPEPWGGAPVVTIVALAKRLAKHLTASVQTKVAAQRTA